YSRNAAVRQVEWVHRNVGQSQTESESGASYTGDAGRDGDVCQACALEECVASDADGVVGNRHCGQTPTIIECGIPEAFNAVRNGDVAQACAEIKRIVSDVSDVGRDRERYQTST